MNFSPYQPPPDAQREQSLLSPSSSSGGGKGKARVGGGSGSSGGGKQKRPWFSRDASSFQGSYQSGGDPSKSYTDAYAYDPSSLDNNHNNNQAGPSSYNYTDNNNQNLPSTSGNNGPGGNPNNVWEASIGFLRVDVLAGLGYLGGPITALLLLIFETTNDYVRFHAYQSGLLTTPIILLWLVMTLIGFWRWLRRLYLFASLAVVLYTAYRAFRDPTSSTQSAGMGLSTGYLPRFYLPIIGDLAERWVGEE
ncbi:hypothetical protein HD553DRAFT_314203 [Filobasidium floriforme]|uniref:uncharacterized protein n=1 Tax=Filobasidium floriforme TaxID=5210 RepID=UPI001E8DE960|nr:uncharacterized protein HD553DRAFT_314203 [Filobasidium floriforme]KAH8082776.1 hypothetical protein HD553DRAFT_314203 [Filobasidium floriforme]